MLHENHITRAGSVQPALSHPGATSFIWYQMSYSQTWAWPHFHLFFYIIPNFGLELLSHATWSCIHLPMLLGIVWSFCHRVQTSLRYRLGRTNKYISSVCTYFSSLFHSTEVLQQKKAWYLVSPSVPHSCPCNDQLCKVNPCSSAAAAQCRHFSTAFPLSCIQVPTAWWDPQPWKLALCHRVLPHSQAAIWCCGPAESFCFSTSGQLLRHSSTQQPSTAVRPFVPPALCHCLASHKTRE